MADMAVVFAGQGAQFVGMGKDLAEAYPACRDLYARADAVLGYPISSICFEGPEEELTRSNRCQPAIFITSVACLEALRQERPGLAFKAAAGLSLGEWSALHVAGVLSFEDTLRILEARGRFMQEACEEREGGMVSIIGLGLPQLREICDAAGVEMANLNSAEQTVLSGDRRAIEHAARLATDAGAKRAIVLNVAGAFHSSLMATAAERLSAFLKEVEFKPAAMPVLSNVTGEPHGAPADIRLCMVQQVTCSVRWQCCVEWFGAHGVGSYVECGPGKVLAGLIKRIDKNAAACSIQDLPTLQKAIETIA